MSDVAPGTRPSPPLSSDVQNRARLLTKVMPPLVRPETVVRRRLHDRIREGVERRVTLVAAGPGFGKSTLLAAWRVEESPSRDVAWLTLAETENDPVALCAYVVEAIRAVRPEFGAALEPAVGSPAPALDEALRRLVNALAREDSLALVLDDFHRVKSGEAQRVVAWIAENSPAGFQLVLATRADPLLPLAALRAHGELVELRSADLAFTPAEADEFLNARLGLDLSSDDVHALVDRTEGWPAGLYLAALSVRHAPDPHEFVRMFGASSRHVVDFLVDEVLRRQPSELQTFMMRCSILERLSGPLCDAVLEREGSHETLASLSRSNLFVSALGERAEWYRFHRLFGTVLRTELERHEPGLVSALHRRAAVWHRAAGDVDSAIDHALAAGAFEDAADMVSEAWVTYLNAGKAASIQAWLNRLPMDVRAPRAELVRADLLTSHARSRADAVGLVETITARYRQARDDPFSQLFARAWSGDVGEAVTWARRTVAAESPESSFWAVACLGLGWCLYFNDDLDESTDWLHEARSVALGRRQWWLAAVAAADLSLVAAQRADATEQQRFAEEAFACLQDHGLADVPGVTGEVYTARGAALAAQGRLSDAREALQRGIELRPANRFQDLDAIVPLIPVLHALGDRQQAAALLAEARTILAECPDPGGFPRRVAELERRFDRRAARPQEAAGELTAAELRVLELLHAGRSERQVGRELYVSFNTVHSHVKSIYRKLGVGSRQEALDEARSLGLF